VAVGGDGSRVHPEPSMSVCEIKMSVKLFMHLEAETLSLPEIQSEKGG